MTPMVFFQCLNEISKPASLDHSASGAKRLRRVLYLVNLDPTIKDGSIEEQAFFLASAFHDRGSLFLPVFLSPMRDQNQAPYQFIGLAVGHLDLQQFKFSTFLRLLRLINDHKIEIVHWNFYGSLSLYIGLLKILKPRVIHYMTDHISRLSPTVPSTGRLKRTVRKSCLGAIRNSLCQRFRLADLAREGCGRLFQVLPFH